MLSVYVHFLKRVDKIYVHFIFVLKVIIQNVSVLLKVGQSLNLTSAKPGDYCSTHKELV